jgi:hypothetical protein
VCSQVHSRIELIAGHIIILEVDETCTCIKFRVWNADLFLETPVMDDSTALISESISAGGGTFYSPHLSAHASPLQEFLYIIWLSTDTYINCEHSIVIRKYCLSPLEHSCLRKEASQPCSSYPRFSGIWWDQHNAAISYAGHMTTHRYALDDLSVRRYKHGLFSLGDSICNASIHRQKKGLKMLRSRWVRTI